MCWKIQLLLGMELYYNNSIVLCGSIATYQSRGRMAFWVHNLNIAQSMSRTGMRGKHGKHTKYFKFSITKMADLFSKQSFLQSCQTTQSSDSSSERMQGSVISGISHYFQDNSTKAVSYSRDHRIIYCVWDSSATTQHIKDWSTSRKGSYVSAYLRFLKILMWSDKFKCHILIVK